MGTSGEATVYGELKLDGLLDKDDVTIKQPGKLLTNGLKSAEAGSYKVTVVSEDKEWKFDPEEPKNYELPEGDPDIPIPPHCLQYDCPYAMIKQTEGNGIFIKNTCKCFIIY